MWAPAALAQEPAASAQEPAAEPASEERGAVEPLELVPLPEGPVATDSDLPPAVRYTGRIVALRTLVAPGGGLPAESLEPLLRVQQDTRYDPQAVRQDIAVLHRVLDFARVEVDVEDWVAFDADGQPVPAVKVEYRVYPPPRLGQVLFRGARALSRRQLLGVIGREPGDPFFSEDEERVGTDIREAYAAIGYPSATVDVATTTDAAGRVTLALTVVEGPPNRVTEVRVRDGGALSGLRVRWILGQAGLGVGRPWTEDALRRARDALTQAVREKGYYEGRVVVQLDPLAEGIRLVVLVDPRRPWQIVRAGKRLPTKVRIVEALGLEEGARLSRRYGEEASRTLTDGLRKAGHLEARVDVVVTEAEDKVSVRVTGTAGPRHRLGSARFSGDPHYDNRYLTGALKEASPELIARGRITPDAVDDALEVLQEFYRSEGYLSADLERVSFTERPGPEQRGAAVVPVDIEVRVDAGPRTVLAAYTVEGDGVEAGGPNGDALFGDLVGLPLNPAEVEARSRRLVEALNEQGFLGADARASTVVSADGSQADVHIVVTTGPTVYLRSVILRGHRRTRRSVIEREIDLRSGDPLAPSRIAAIRRRLYELDLFSRVSAELVGDEDRVKDLIVEVEERPNLHAEIGGGVATDLGVKLFVRGGHRNLFGLGHRLTLLAQAGVGWVGDGWSLDVLAPEWKAAARYEAPNIPARGERVALDVTFNEQQQEPTYRLERSGGGLGVLLHLGAYGTAELAYRVQFRRLLDVDPGAIVPGDPWLDELGIADVDDLALTLPSAVRAQSGLDLSFVLDLRDDPFNPTRGGVGNLLVNVTDQVLSDLTYLRAEGSWAWWAPIGGFGLQGRLRAGAAWVPGTRSSAVQSTLPLEDRFRLGGGASLRGFALDEVGPANEVAREHIDFNDGLGPIVAYGGRDAPSRWVPTGGDAMALGSLEFRIPFERLGLAKWEGTQLAFFADVGNVWFLHPDVTDSMKLAADDGNPALRWSVGVGLRRATVIGPIQVDVGFNPAPIEAREESVVRLHVSLGAL
ncbi:MAG: BamA/TamA family outer membrane protein [Pseudomonadota bacterium]|nr:BamA/TamA family outer membrane protein [Pseudomonadota bacterium]